MGPTLSRRRRLTGLLLAAGGLPALAAGLHAASGVPLTDDILLFLAAVVGIALVGGLGPALLAAVGGFALLNYYFIPPVRTFAIATEANLVAVTVFVVVALGVSWVVDLAARRTRQAAQAADEARTLAVVAGGVLRGADPLDALLRELHERFSLSSVALLERVPGGSWTIAAGVGETGADGAEIVAADDGHVLELRGRALNAGERRVVGAFAAQAAVALRQQRLAAVAATARTHADSDRMRTALLAAVSHDLRTPLASAKAAVAGLRSADVAFDEADRAELLATADESLDRLTALVANLLDMSRLQAGVLGISPADLGLEDVVPRALGELGEPGRLVRVELPDELPEVRADPGLLERVLVNVIGNAVRYSPPGRPAVIRGTVRDATVELRVIDYGPGIPAADWERVFLPFQRLGDRDNHTGVGLGLALARGLTEAMGGTLRPEPTPGGGLTMVIAIPSAGVMTDCTERH
jgi:two-component system, OmpR family, sensor histidine kinase KdpD